MKFSDLEFKPHPVDPDGIKATVAFDNGYSASVFRTNFSVGRKEGHYEIFVLDAWSMITAISGLTDDNGSIAPCDEAKIDDVLAKVEALTPETVSKEIIPPEELERTAKKL